MCLPVVSLQVRRRRPATAGVAAPTSCLQVKSLVGNLIEAARYKTAQEPEEEKKIEKKAEKKDKGCRQCGVMWMVAISASGNGLCVTI